MDFNIKDLKRSLKQLSKHDRNTIVRLYKAKIYSRADKIKKELEDKVLKTAERSK